MSKFTILTLIILNLIDGILTYIGIEKGFYKEENPILAYAYNLDEKLFIFVKIILITMILIFIMKLIDKQKISYIIKCMIFTANTIYLFIVFYHVYLISAVYNQINLL